MKNYFEQLPVFNGLPSNHAHDKNSLIRELIYRLTFLLFVPSQREARESLEELKRIRSELAAARSSEAEAKKALAAAVAADKLRKADYNQLKQAHAALQHK